MIYTDIENFTVDKNDEQYEQVVINWRKRLGRLQLRCPRCDNFFKVPKDTKFDNNGYANTSIYHFCQDTDDENFNDLGWVVWPHLVGYNG